MNIGVPIVTCLHRVCRILKTAQTLRNHHHMCMVSGHHSPSPVGRADCMCLWTSMLLHSLLLTDDACSSSSLSTTVIKFSIFSVPTRILSALPPELRRIYGNGKTTTLLPSAKCTRPLFHIKTMVELAAASVHPIGMISSHASG